MDLLASLKEHQASAGSRNDPVREATRGSLHDALLVLCEEGSTLRALRLGR